MAYGAQQGANDSYAADYTEMERRLALREQAQKRQALESLAAQGALTGGARQAREQEVSAGIGELWHSGAQAIESRRFAAGEAEKQRGWQTGERTGSEAATASLQQNQIEATEAMQQNQISQDQWSQLTADEQEKLMAATNARNASDLSKQEAGQTSALSSQESGQTLTQMGAGFGYSQTLQTQAEQARSALQAQVDAGQMTLQEAENQWQGVQADLNRQQELTTQGIAIVQEQWMAQFGQEGALALQEHQQVFEDAMADLARKWEIDDRPWDQQLWLEDAQLQMTVAGWNWNDDDLSGGVPAWIAGLETPEGVAPTALAGTQGVSAGSTAGGTSQLVWYLGRQMPIEEARQWGYTG